MTKATFTLEKENHHEPNHTDRTDIGRCIHAWKLRPGRSKGALQAQEGPASEEEGKSFIGKLKTNIKTSEKKTGKKEVTEYTVAYSLNDNKVKYAPYGYVIDKNNEWKQSDNPVKKCVGDTKDIFFSLVTVVGLILMYKFR